MDWVGFGLMLGNVVPREEGKGLAKGEILFSVLALVAFEVIHA
jgi:hypothetical protein